MFNIYPYINVNDLNLDWIIKHFKEFIDNLASLNEWRQTHESEYQELKEFMDRINAGELPEAVYEELRTWIETNAIDIIGSLVRSVYFGITDDGYFVAYIPESWDDIIFNTTGLDINVPLQPEYGHLVLSY